jgi:hypothetical protein
MLSSSSRSRRAALVVVAGVPGAGKTTALRSAARAGVRVLDPEHQRDWLRARVPAGVPCSYRPLTHLAHRMLVIAVLLRGPGGGSVLVHDPGTRTWLRRLIGALGWLRGWSSHLLLIEVSRDDALLGQQRRRRVVRARAFDRHWRRWVRLRAALDRRGARAAGWGWDAVTLVRRDQAKPAVAAAAGVAPSEAARLTGRPRVARAT